MISARPEPSPEREPLRVVPHAGSGSRHGRRLGRGGQLGRGRRAGRETAVMREVRSMREARSRREAGRTRRRRTLRIVSAGLPVALVALIFAVTAGMMLGRWRFAVIDSGSMRPVLDPGDVAVMIAEPIADLRVGQIIAFHPPGQPITVAHRVVSIRRTAAGVAIRTKGDANNAIDSWHATLTGPTVFHEALRVAKLGYLVVFAEQRWVRFAVLLATVMSAVAMLLGSIWRGEARRPSLVSRHLR